MNTLKPGDRCLRLPCPPLPAPTGGYGAVVELVEMGNGRGIGIGDIRFPCSYWDLFIVGDIEVLGWPASHLMKLPDDDMRREFKREAERETRAAVPAWLLATHAGEP